VSAGSDVRITDAVSRLFRFECNSVKQSLQNIALYAESPLKSSMIAELRLSRLFFVCLFIFTEL
jgi:hypothetical protein